MFFLPGWALPARAEYWAGGEEEEGDAEEDVSKVWRHGEEWCVSWGGCCGGHRKARECEQHFLKNKSDSTLKQYFLEYAEEMDEITLAEYDEDDDMIYTRIIYEKKAKAEAST